MTGVERTALLSLGSNLGPAERIFEAARQALAREPGVTLLAASPVERSAALGPTQPVFANQLLRLRTSLPAPTLLALLQAIERRLGRRAHHRRWGPRILDLDLLAYDERRHLDAHLRLPHPGLGRGYLRPLLDALEEG
ncbi:MAG: 2-amino-4-hydroxy-6-hydroxymethyldihydropteridine diphosphokinase [Deltaproteobacteria bacterium]|nr:2-amino-4-hydroxy-6-hydroxymethyldihydropteridine diphosphokinase [Deltaproteobacteria bacterium]